MTPAEKVSAALQQFRVSDFDLVWKTSPHAKRYDFVLNAEGNLFRGSTLRAVIRAAWRHYSRSESGQQPRMVRI